MEGSANCVLCHPELYGKNINWTVLCRDHMNECIADSGSVLAAFDHMDEWIRGRLKKQEEKD